MLEEVNRLVAEGRYEKALASAKRAAIEALKQNRRDEAAFALSRAGEILCALNNPARARSFAQESLDLASRSNHKGAAGQAYAVSALAWLRQGDLEKAEAALDRALELSPPDGPAAPAVFVRLVAAEVALAKEDFADARAFAEDASSLASGAADRPLRAKALLVKAICEERAENLEGSIELLKLAEEELAPSPHAEAQWQVRAAMANALQKAGREDQAAAYRMDAAGLLTRLADELSGEARERFLKNPAVALTLGGEASSSGFFRMPVQIAPRPPKKPRDETQFLGFRPVLEVIKKINSELNLRNLLTTILDTMIEMCNAERGTIVVFESENLKFDISRGRGGLSLEREDMVISRGILKLVKERGRKIVADDAQRDPELKLIDTVQSQGLLSILCVPLRVKLRLVGAVYLDNPNRTGAFGPREIELAEILTDHAAVAIDNALLHIRSIHDTLTNLYNHPHFEKRLESEIARCKRHGRPCSLLMLDIDNFKDVNDSHGHHAGNELLRASARVLVNAVRSVDLVARIQERDVSPVVARYGGDEFEIILPETDGDGARRVAERILEAMEAAKFRYNDHLIKITVSIGGATFPNDAPDHRDLILRTDEALYAAKRSGKNRYCAYAKP